MALFCQQELQSRYRSLILVVGGRLGWMILEIFSNLNGSVIYSCQRDKIQPLKFAHSTLRLNAALELACPCQFMLLLSGLPNYDWEQSL